MNSLLEQLSALVRTMPPGSSISLPVEWLREQIETEITRLAAPPATSTPVESASWRERLWTCPPDTRFGVQELMEAVGRSQDWVYRAASKKWANDRDRDPLPHRRLDREYVFVAGEVRDWLERNEEVIVRGRTTRTVLRSVPGGRDG